MSPSAEMNLTPSHQGSVLGGVALRTNFARAGPAGDPRGVAVEFNQKFVLWSSFPISSRVYGLLPHISSLFSQVPSIPCAGWV